MFGKQLWFLAKRRLGGASEATDPGAEAAPPPSSASDLRRLARHLKKTLEKEGTLTAGAVFMLNLDGLQAELGDKWAPLSDKVDSTIRSVLRRRLTEADLYTQQGELLYLIVFGRLGKVQAEDKCRRIADEIRMRLIGQAEEAVAASIGTAVAELDKGINLQDLDGARIAERVLAGKEARNVAPAVSGKDRRAEVNTVSRRTEGQAIPPAPAAAEEVRRAQDDPEWRPLVRRPVPAADPRDQEVADVQAKLLAKTAPARPAPPVITGEDAVEGPPEQWKLKFIYRPMWFVPRQVVSIYLCLPASQSSQGPMVIGDGLAVAAVEEGAAGIDIMCLHRASKDLGILALANRRQLVCVPVSYETLMRPAIRMIYLEACRRLPEEIRGFLVCELTGLPETAPASQVQEVVGFLRNQFRKVIVRLSASTRDFGALRESRIETVGFDAAASHVSEQKMMQHLNLFADRAKRNLFKIYVHGLPSMSLTTAAVAAGFDYIDGEAVESVLDQPNGVYAFSLTDLYQSVLDRRPEG